MFYESGHIKIKKRVCSAMLCFSLPLLSSLIGINDRDEDSHPEKVLKECLEEHRH